MQCLLILRYSKDFENNLKLISGVHEFPSDQVSVQSHCCLKYHVFFLAAIFCISGTDISLYDFTLKELSLRVIILVQKLILFV